MSVVFDGSREWEILTGDCLDVLAGLPKASVQTCITSPPYWGLRDYGVAGQLGLEPTVDEYVANMVKVFAAVRDVLTDDGTLWLNLGDSYAAGGKTDPYRTTSSGKKMPPQGRAPVAAGLKPKDLVGVPWRVAFALQADGWYLRSDIIWHKPNAMPESVKDRPTKAHEYLFLLSKSPKYMYDADAVREPHTDPVSVARHKDTGRGRQAYANASGVNSRPQRDSNSGLGGHPNGRNRRSVWSVNTRPYSGAHFAVFPPALVEPCVLAGSREGDVVLDPFNGAGTTGLVALQHGRRYVGIELNPEYVALAEDRLKTVQRSFAAV